MKNGLNISAPALAVALLALAAAIAVAVLLVRVARRRARSRQALQRAPKPRHPIVLAHGIFGFDALELPVGRQEYFRGVADHLRQVGAQVHVTRVHPLASIKHRAEELARAVRLLDARRVNIIAHSMGGLDARYAIARLGLSERVASLITVGTPHRGTPVADVGSSVLGDRLLRVALTRLGLTADALHDLTTARMQAFNEEVPDARGVFYASYLARTQGRALAFNPLLLPTYLYLSGRAGENDGLVPTSSQRWGELLGEVEADHWAQIGWSVRFDAPGFYAEVLRELAQRGV